MEWALGPRAGVSRSSYPRWDGRSAGKRLVVGEEGFGDVIQFAGFLPDLRRRG
jgi:hypothetical protein